MKSLAIIGGDGMIGSDLVEYLSRSYQVTSITRGNYANIVGKKFDIVINANGNSRRYWANQNPVEDFVASTESVVRSIFDFPCAIYVYLSTPDVYFNHTHSKYTREESLVLSEKLDSYGLNKYLAELLVKKYSNRFIILRLSMVLGSNLKKGPVYDVLNGIKLFVTISSKIQMITSSALADIIKSLLLKKVVNQIVNVGGIGVVPISEVGGILNKVVIVSTHAVDQRYEMNVKKLRRLYPNLETSKQYLVDYISSK